MSGSARTGPASGKGHSRKTQTTVNYVGRKPETAQVRSGVTERPGRAH